MESKFNMRNPAVKRIMQEIKEMQAETSPECIAEALEDDIFEWHFVVRGPPDTEFEGGIYHGRILLPAEYPFKPPSFMMLTPNGRFQTGVKICLSISSHHPEHWQPSWSVRTALTALMAFMPTPGQGALGSIDFTKEERQQLAAKSRTDVPKFGSAARQKVIADMHQRMLDLQNSAAAAASSSSSSNNSESPGATATAAAAANSQAADSDTAAADDISSDQSSKQQQQQQQQQAVAASTGGSRSSSSDLQSDTSGHDQQRPSSAGSVTGGYKPATQEQEQQPPTAAAAAAAAAPTSPVSPAVVMGMAQQLSPQQQQQLLAHVARHRAAAAAGQAATAPGDVADRGLTFLAVVLTVAIVAMLFKKVMTAMAGYRLMV